MTPDRPVTRAEFDAVKEDHERRLDGHDSLYRDVRKAHEELIRFRETLQQVQREMDLSLTERDKNEQDCLRHREDFSRRLRVLERFRWQISTAITIIAVIPTWVMLYLNITGGC